MKPPLPNIIDRVRFHAANRPDATAFRFLADGERESDSMTFAGLDQRAREIASHLRELGAAGRRVLLLLPQDLRFITGFFGCLYAGAAAVPMFVPRPKRPVTTLLAAARDAVPAAVLTTREIRAYLEAHMAAEFPEIAWCCIEEIAEAPLQPAEVSIPDDGLAFLQYTSGSTSVPKGVMVSHASLADNIEAMRSAFSVSAETVYGGWLPTYHDMGLIGLVLAPAWFGVPSILMPALSFLQKPVRWPKLISRYGITVSGGPNFAYGLCVDRIGEQEREGLDLSSWSVAFNGSEAVRSRTIERFNEVFGAHGFRSTSMYPCYGLAEATLFVTGGGCGNEVIVRDVDAKELQCGRARPAGGNQRQVSIVSCGRTWNGTRIEIVDPSTRSRLPDGKIGEIWVAGPGVALGYFGRPELTAEVFHARLADRSAQEYLRTGDLGFSDKGVAYVTGRLKDVIIIRGRNYYPQDIEQTVERSSIHLREAAGTAFCIELAGEEKLVLVQELKRTSLNAEHGNIVRDIQQAIAAEHGLSVHGIMLVKPATVPKTSSGKLRRLACRDIFMRNELEVVHGYINRISGEEADLDRSRAA